MKARNLISLLVEMHVIYFLVGARVTSATHTDCLCGPTDILIAIHTPASASDFAKLIDFVGSFVRMRDLDLRTTRIGLATFTNTPASEVLLNVSYDKDTLLAVINNTSHISGGTRTDLILRFAREFGFNVSTGSADVTRVLIPITDHLSDQPAATRVEANKIHLENITILTIGIAPNIDESELIQIASNARNFFQAPNFDVLHTIEMDLNHRLCEITCLRATAVPVQSVTPTPMPGVTTRSPPLPVCVYNGKSYSQGQKWQDGCQYDCECVDGMSGQYRCTERCPIYNNIPPYCRMVTSRTDACCREPECSIPLPQSTPSPNVTPAHNRNPGTVTVAPNPNPNPNSNPNLQVTPVPSPNQTPASQPMPQPKYCVMNGKSYTQGQRWNDGCTQMCVCDDSMTGHYTCSPRCKVYTSIPKECTMVPDPNDPMCCRMPSCNPSPQNPNPTPPPGHISGGIVTPAPTPMPHNSTMPQPGQTPAPTPAPVPKNVCIYKGRTYTQGQKWQDGCDYNCECVNSMSGFYDCQEMCAKYPNLPAQCRLVQDYNKPCCQVPSCSFTGTTGQVTGQLTTPVPIPGQTPAPQPNPNPTNTPTPKRPYQTPPTSSCNISISNNSRTSSMTSHSGDVHLLTSGTVEPGLTRTGEILILRKRIQSSINHNNIHTIVCIIIALILLFLSTGSCCVLLCDRLCKQKKNTRTNKIHDLEYV